MTFRNRWRFMFDRPNPLLKQAPTVVALTVAFALVFFLPELTLSDEPLALTGGAVVLASTLYALVLSWRNHYDGLLVYLVPMLDIVGIGMFRAGTGAGASLFGALVLLPIVWLATAPGFAYVIVVVALTSLAILGPYIFGPPVGAEQWLRGVITPLVFAAVAFVINELSRQQRLRAEEAEDLVEQRTRALAVNEQMIVQLRQAEQKYRTLLDSYHSLWSSITAQAVLATDTDGRVSAWAPGAESLLGLSEADALGVGIDRFFPSDVLEMLAEEHQNLPDAVEHAALSPGVKELFATVDAEGSFDGSLEVLTARGETVPARVTVTPRKGYGEQERGFLLVITDETRANEVARMKDEFVGMISHELRTPLSSILGFLDLLRSDPEQPLSEDQREFVEVIERNAKRLLSLVGDLLFTAQAESGRFPIVRQLCDLREIVESAVDSAAPAASRREVSLVVESPETPVQVRLDPERIGQALDNLLSNAIKFTQAGGSVFVGTRALEDAVELWVRDTGIGIPKNEQGMLFTRFFRASSATRNAVPGVGLGLTITRAIVLAHGGSMHVESQEGVGTEFRVRLPLDIG